MEFTSNISMSKKKSSKLLNIFEELTPPILQGGAKEAALIKISLNFPPLESLVVSTYHPELLLESQ